MDQDQEDNSFRSSSQRIKPSQEKNIKDFEFFQNKDDKDEITTFFKFKLEDLIDPTIWSQISHNEEIPDDKHQLEFLDEGHQDFQKYIKTKNFEIDIIGVAKLKVNFRPKKIYPREKHVALNIDYTFNIMDENKCNFYGIIDVYSKGYCNNVREKLIQKKKSFQVSSKCQQYQITITKKLFPEKGDEILWEIIVEPHGVLAQEQGLPIGLTNLGVTCYMNSYLQTMFHLKYFRKYVANLDNENKEDSFIFALQSLFYQMQQMKNAPANTYSLVKSFNWDFTEIFTQQDVQEFSFMFFEAIEKKSKQQGIQKDIIKQIFEGSMESFIKCKDIDYESKREEIFTDLQLIIEGQDNIYQALTNHFKSITLEGENAYQTEGHGKKDAEKGLRLKTMPKVLTFQLNRFQYNYEFEENQKILSKFEFYEEINLDEFCESNMQNQQYQLFAVNSHIGLRTNQGHYKAYIKINNQWLEFDDDIVTKVDFEYVKKNSFGGMYNDICLDLKNFGLRIKKKQEKGHAYRLIYIKKDNYDQIVDNFGEEIQFSENIQVKNQITIKDLQDHYFQKEHFNLVFTFKENFVGKDTGISGLFCKKFHLDDFKIYLNQQNLLCLYVKKTVLKRNFFAVIEQNFNLENNQSDEETQSENEESVQTKYNRFYSLYIYDYQFGCLKHFCFEDFINQTKQNNEENTFYFFIDVHNQQLSDESLIIIKTFDLPNLCYQVEDVFSLDSSNTFKNVLSRIDLKEPYICKKYLYQNKFEDIDENQYVLTNTASSEIVIVIIKNAEGQDEQIFQKFFNKMYFIIQITLQYEKFIQKFFFQMNLPSLEIFKKIKESLQIPQEQQIIIKELRINSRKKEYKESQMTNDSDLNLLAKGLYKSPILQIELEKNEEISVGYFSIYIFGIQGIQLVSSNDIYDNTETIEELNQKIKEDQDLIKHLSFVQQKIGQVNLQIKSFDIFQIKENECWSQPTNFLPNTPYNIILVPVYEYVYLDSQQYEVKLQFYEEGRVVYQYPLLKLCLPNFSLNQLIQFFQKFFEIFEVFGDKEKRSTYLIRENVELFRYSKRIGENFTLGTTLDENLEQMSGELKKVVINVNFNFRQQQQKTGIKINV